MAYLRKVWKDHVVQHPKTYTIADNPDGTKTLTDAPGEIIQPGTPMNAANFNNIEDAIVYYTAAFEMNYAITQALLRKLAELASTTGEGLAPQATAPASGLLNVLGIGNAETAYSIKALFDATVPATQALGDAAAAGSAMAASRRDHKHAMPTLASIAAALETVEAATAFKAYYAISQALIRDLDTRLTIAEEELAAIP